MDTKKATERTYQLLDKVLDMQLGLTEEKAGRKLKSIEASPAEAEDESILLKSQRELAKNGGKKIIKDIPIN